MAVQTSLVVQFTSSDGGDAGGSGILIAEIDGRSVDNGGLNGGKTSGFLPGDTVSILVYKTNNVSLEDPVSSEGIVTIANTPQVIIPVSENLTFINTNKASLSKPIYGDLTVGVSRVSGGDNSDATIELLSPSSVITVKPVGTVITNPNIVGIVAVSYETVAIVYEFKNAYGDMPVLIFISGTAY